MAESALDQFGLGQVVWVPSHHPTHKQTHLLDFAHRLEMVQQAIAEQPKFVASALEQNQRTPSYAHETFAQLHASDPAASWHWIIGVDAFQTLPHWRNSVDFVAQCLWLVAPRNQTVISTICPWVEKTVADKSVRLRWRTIQMPQIDISSSLIRQYCQVGRSLQYLVPESVRVYINTNNLYQTPEYNPPSLTP
jgi:nicotinate-nucleotide adenylyltransferase